jgi:diguanylate cyclase (GGDEF)-like protein
MDEYTQMHAGMEETIVVPPGYSKQRARQVFGTSGKSFQLLLDRLIRIGCLVVALVGVGGLCGWIFDIPRLLDVQRGQVFMGVNVACALIVASVAVLLLHTQPQGSAWFRVARCLAVMLLALGGLSMTEHLFGLNLGIDLNIESTHLEIPLAQVEAHRAHPGRISVTTSLYVVFLGLALLALKARRPNLAACANWLVAPPLLASGLAVLGYAYGASSLYAVRPYGTIAAHTAASFLVLSLCVLAADSTRGFTSIAISDTSGGMVTRRLLPTIPILIFVLGLVRLKGQEFGLYDIESGSALMVLMSTAFCVIAVAWTATTLHKVDLVRKLIEADNLSLNAGLESRVQERTRELAQVSSQLRLVNGTLELLSNQDGLTGLANRRRFDAHLSKQIPVARRYGRSLALVLCDVDSFKAYNDHYGHLAGDECLKRIAAALRSCCRRPADMVARYGGEEFALILPETGLDDATRIAEAARDAVVQLAIAHEKSPTVSHVTISGGIAVLLRNGISGAKQLITEADQCLYQAKHLGRNRMVAAEAELGQAIA